jgi:hypothetical protein
MLRPCRMKPRDARGSPLSLPLRPTHRGILIPPCVSRTALGFDDLGWEQCGG